MLDPTLSTFMVSKNYNIGHVFQPTWSMAPTWTVLFAFQSLNKPSPWWQITDSATKTLHFNGKIAKSLQRTDPLGSCEKVIHKKSVGKFKKFEFAAFPTDFLCITFSQDPTGSVHYGDFAIFSLLVNYKIWFGPGANRGQWSKMKTLRVGPNPEGNQSHEGSKWPPAAAITRQNKGFEY